MNATETRCMGVRGDWMHAERDGVKRARWVMLCMVWAAGCTDVPNPKCLSESPAPGCPVVDGGVVDSGADGSVACVESSQCGDASKPVCDTGAGVCVECLATADCPASEPVCDAATKTCAACQNANDCARFSDTKVCGSAGACIQCNAADETACTAGVCDLTTSLCTTRSASAVGQCLPCVNDRECTDGRCVATTFKGQPHGNYCLQVKSGNCSSGFVAMPSRSSLSVPSESLVFCGPNENYATCEAINDRLASKDCAPNGPKDNSLCGKAGVDDGWCVDLKPGTTNICSYQCSDASECPISADRRCAQLAGAQPTDPTYCLLNP
jgi:hypothetical protein